jgi:hypothetical protein
LRLTRKGVTTLSKLRLWTLKEYSLWESLNRHGVLYVNPELADQDYIEAYDWMRQQMKLRLKHYEGHYPWWAYHRPKPDLRKRFAGTFLPGTRCVRLELEIDEDRVLLSNRSAWEYILMNNSYIELTDEEDKAWRDDLKQHGLKPWASSLPEPLKSRREDTWQRIFELDLLQGTGYWMDDVQGVFEELRLSDVVKVTEYIARNRN